MTLAKWLQRAESRLLQAGIESARLESQVLAAHSLDVDRAWVLAHPDSQIDPSNAETLLERRARREPLAYLLGWREFYGRRFEVRPGVLIPRQETELLVEGSLQLLEVGPNPTVLDLGTGSGCIAVTLKLERPGVRVVASDASAEAVRVAKQNAQALGADLEFVVADGCTAFARSAFDLIATNPPYIDPQEPLMPEVALHEPAQALYGGAGGLDFFRRLAREAPSCLKHGGHLVCEVGHGQAPQVARLFQENDWGQRFTRQDLSGIDRVLAFRLGEPA